MHLPLSITNTNTDPKKEVRRFVHVANHYNPTHLNFQLLMCYCQHFYDLMYSGSIIMHTVMIARMKCLSVD